MGPGDAELIERWNGGDPSAFEDLVRRWQEPIGRFLFRLTGEPELASELCQDVFLRVYCAGPRYRENGAFSAWVYQIALNAVRDAGRRRKNRAGLLSDVDSLVDRGDTAETACQRREETRLIAAAVAGLPEALRIVLVLHHYERMNFAEIARLTGTPASTLKSRYAAALERLRERLHQLGIGPEETEA